ncbi:hypothetical protein ACEPPN_005987 [Leptodophora sp. 'Broadleaf-Isolate-01']
MEHKAHVLPSLEVAKMRHQIAVWKPEDDWTGVTSAAERRTLQNRLNQRIYRKRRSRKPELHSSELESTSSTEPTESPPENRLLGKFAGLVAVVGNNTEETGNPEPPEADGWQPRRCAALGGSRSISPTQLDAMIARYEAMARRDYMLGSPKVDQLLTLIQFNVFRALISNTFALGWTLDWLTCAEPLSPWNTTTNDRLLSCPQALRPTTIQRTIEHHPWIDLWPMPKMRDNLLLAGDSYDEDQLCNDLVEFGDVTHEQTGLIVWSEPWDSMGWEVSEAFLKKWAWTVRGCEELLHSTNYWRAKRGENPVFF